MKGRLTMINAGKDMLERLRADIKDLHSVIDDIDDFITMFSEMKASNPEKLRNFTFPPARTFLRKKLESKTMQDIDENDGTVVNPKFRKWAGPDGYVFKRGGDLDTTAMSEHNKAIDEIERLTKIINDLRKNHGEKKKSALTLHCPRCKEIIYDGPGTAGSVMRECIFKCNECGWSGTWDDINDYKCD